MGSKQNKRAGLLGERVAKVLPCSGQLAFTLSWLPLINLANDMGGTDSPSALALVVAFFLAGAIAAFLLRSPSLAARWRPLCYVQCGLCIASSLFALALEQSPLAALATFTGFGASTAIGITLWFERYHGLGAAAFTVSAICGLAIFSLIPLALAQCAGNVTFVVTALASMAVFAIEQGLPPLHADTGKSKGERISKLLDLASARLAMRHVVASSVLGIITGVMLTMFIHGMPDPKMHMLVAGLPIGLAVLLLLLLITWVCNREPNATHTLKLSFFVALIAFFPFYPGSLLNQNLSLVMGGIWIMVLLGTFLLVSRDVQLACSAAQRQSFIPAMALLFAGVALGCACMGLALESSWYNGFAAHAYQRIVLATLIGASAIVLAYVASNILLNEESLRRARLAAQGKFVAIIQSEEPGDPRECTQRSEPTRFEATCRDIALQYGLTPREFDMLVVLAKGNSMARAREELVISEGTAITHRRNLYRKLGVVNKQELIDFVSKHSVQ